MHFSVHFYLTVQFRILIQIYENPELLSFDSELRKLMVLLKKCTILLELIKVVVISKNAYQRISLKLTDISVLPTPVDVLQLLISNVLSSNYLCNFCIYYL